MRILIVGFGTVGQGLAELLVEKRRTLHDRYGLEPRVVGISDVRKGSAYDPDGLDLEAILRAVENGEGVETAGPRFEGEALEMIEAAEAEAMVEATYTNLETGEPGTSHVRAALVKGMHVTTSNKGPVALHLAELAKLARANGVHLLYEGTVMSGTPVLNLVRQTLAGSEISQLRGILNGTTNFILTRMEDGLSYELALKEAQELGYAEAVPDADVEGHDALGKITILANAVFRIPAKPADFPCTGITGITGEAIAEAKERGARFKLIGKLWRDGDELRGSVAPEEVPLTHPLAGVSGATNAITLSTDTLGEVTVVGPGAGRRETGYSLLIDLINLAGAG